MRETYDSCFKHNKYLDSKEFPYRDLYVNTCKRLLGDDQIFYSYYDISLRYLNDKKKYEILTIQSRNDNYSLKAMMDIYHFDSEEFETVKIHHIHTYRNIVDGGIKEFHPDNDKKNVYITTEVNKKIISYIVYKINPNKKNENIFRFNAPSVIFKNNYKYKIEILKKRLNKIINLQDYISSRSVDVILDVIDESLYSKSTNGLDIDEHNYDFIVSILDTIDVGKYHHYRNKPNQINEFNGFLYNIYNSIRKDNTIIKCKLDDNLYINFNDHERTPTASFESPLKYYTKWKLNSDSIYPYIKCIDKYDSYYFELQKFAIEHI